MPDVDGGVRDGLAGLGVDHLEGEGEGDALLVLGDVLAELVRVDVVRAFGGLGGELVTDLGGTGRRAGLGALARLLVPGEGTGGKRPTRPHGNGRPRTGDDDLPARQIPLVLGPVLLVRAEVLVVLVVLVVLDVSRHGGEVRRPPCQRGGNNLWNSKARQKDTRTRVYFRPTYGKGDPEACLTWGASSAWHLALSET